jgi:hypothetical protein
VIIFVIIHLKRCKLFLKSKKTVTNERRRFRAHRHLCKILYVYLFYISYIDTIMYKFMYVGRLIVTVGGGNCELGDLCIMYVYIYIYIHIYTCLLMHIYVCVLIFLHFCAFLGSLIVAVGGGNCELGDLCIMYVHI